MSIKRFSIIFIIFIIVITIILGLNLRQNPNQPKQETPQEQLKVISTNPDPLEGATILPTQTIEITFNKPVNTSEFKHRFDPELEHRVEVVNSSSSYQSHTFRMIFDKPLKLGSGYTLFILPNTHTEDGLKLDQEIIYHFKTISYRGV